MATPFTKYLEIKDNYCISYLGKDKKVLNKLLEARNFIEKELEGLKIFIVCNDVIKIDGENIILVSDIKNHAGKFGGQCEVKDEKEVKNIILESKIPIPKEFLNS